jgi:hypothetical protein
MSFSKFMNSKINWYAIERQEVESKNFRGIEKLIKAMELKGKSGRQTLTITFSGYDHVVDEIFEIMPIRQFVKVLLQKHPYLFYYLQVDTECLQNVILCYADVETVFIGERKAIADYPIEDVLTNNLPQQAVSINVEGSKLRHWKKSIRNYGIKMNDLEGAVKVISDIEKIFSK